MKLSRDRLCLSQEKKGAGRDSRSVFPPRKPERLSAWDLQVKAKLGKDQGLCAATLDLLMRRVRILPRNGDSGWGELESQISVASKTFKPFLG